MTWATSVPMLVFKPLCFRLIRDDLFYATDRRQTDRQIDVRQHHRLVPRLEKVKVKEADLYSAFIEVPYTQGAQVRITQCYLQTTPYLHLTRKHSPDGASQTEVADI